MNQPILPAENEDCFKKTPWNRAGIWTGASLRALLGILKQNQFQVHWSCWPECLVDLMFATMHSGMGMVEAVVYGSRIRRVEVRRDPLIVIGHWRTGTTYLHELLALDPNHIYPTTYQCFIPGHFLLTEHALKPWIRFVLPPSRLFDGVQMGWDRPQEDEFALCNLGIPSPYATIAFPNRPPRNQAYLELDALTDRQRSRWQTGFQQFLQRISYSKSGRLLLKSPTHTFRIPILLDMFPDARFVNLVRHPLAIFMSTIRLWKSLFAMHGYQKPDYQGLAEYVFEVFDRMHRRLDATRPLVPNDRFLDIRYEDLVDHPLASVQHIYTQLDLGDLNLVRPAIERYIHEHSSHQPHPHAPTAELADQVFDRWQSYYEKYGYERTPGRI